MVCSQLTNFKNVTRFKNSCTDIDSCLNTNNNKINSS